MLAELTLRMLDTFVSIFLAVLWFSPPAPQQGEGSRRFTPPASFAYGGQALFNHSTDVRAIGGKMCQLSRMAVAAARHRCYERYVRDNCGAWKVWNCANSSADSDS